MQDHKLTLSALPVDCALYNSHQCGVRSILYIRRAYSSHTLQCIPGAPHSSLSMSVLWGLSFLRRLLNCRGRTSLVPFLHLRSLPSLPLRLLLSVTSIVKSMRSYARFLFPALYSLPYNTFLYIYFFAWGKCARPPHHGLC